MTKERADFYPLGSWIAWTVLLPLGAVILGLVVVAAVPARSLPFDHPHCWWMFAIVPLGSLIALYGRARRKRSLERFTSPELAPLLAARLNPGRQALRMGLIVLALALLVMAALGPRWGIYMEKQKVYGVDAVVALDVSRSMLARDVLPNRLEYAKTMIRQQLTERAIFRRANRLGLMAFAGTTSLRVPLTTDHFNFRTKLEAVQVGSVPRGGTAIARALESSIELFSKSLEEATKIVLIFTDGEDHEGGAIEAAKIAQEKHGIHVYTIGVGDPARTAGVEVPSGEGSGQKPLLHEGQIVFSKLDTEGLRRIAEAGGGQYAAISDWPRLVDAIAAMQPAQLGVEERQRHRPRYQWFVAAALFCLGWGTLLREGRVTSEGLPKRVWLQESSAA